MKLNLSFVTLSSTEDKETHNIQRSIGVLKFFPKPLNKITLNQIMTTFNNHKKSYEHLKINNTDNEFKMINIDDNRLSDHNHEFLSESNDIELEVKNNNDDYVIKNEMLKELTMEIEEENKMSKLIVNKFYYDNDIHD